MNFTYGIIFQAAGFQYIETEDLIIYSGYTLCEFIPCPDWHKFIRYYT